ncbi:Antibiotic ABC transporter, ATP-binding protein [Bacillus cereus Rock3-44]|nr:Antibiotic ABC transporter, ATP-binding protein [Bacillus cereus Rock3-44]
MLKERLYGMINEQQSIVKVDRLTKRIGSKTLVENISFEVKKGEVVGLLGPNGAGKTTLMRMMVGMIRMTEGEVWIDGQSVKQEFESTAAKVGAVIENPEFYPFLSGYENLTYFGRMNGNVTEERIDEVVQLLGMGQVINRKVRAYSLGMRQRLGIAQALVHNPDVLILDEPTNGLDPNGIHEMRMYIKKIAHEQGKAVLVSSHLLSEVELMCDRVIIIQHGEYVATQNIQRDNSLEMETIHIRVDDVKQAAELLEYDVTIQDNELVMAVENEEIPNVIRTLTEQGIRIYRVYEERKTLEEKFLELTGGKDIV